MDYKRFGHQNRNNVKTPGGQTNTNGCQNEHSPHNGSHRKLQREENKKRKLGAYLKIAKLNDKERSRAENSGLETNGDAVGHEKPSKKMRKLLPSELSEDDSLEELDLKDLKALRAEITARRNKSMSRPKLIINSTGLSARFEAAAVRDADPLFALDIQHLVLKGLAGGQAPVFPKWCDLHRPGHISHIVVIYLEGTSISSCKANWDQMKTLTTFDDVFEVVPPIEYGSCVLKELIWVNLSKRCRNRFFPDHTTFETAIKANVIVCNDPYSPLFNINQQSKTPDNAITHIDKECLEQCTKMTLLLNPQQMFMENFPFPYSVSELGDVCVPTKDTYEKVTNNSPMFGLDCEMCLTTNNINELTRVSIVNEELKSIYDTLVLPRAKIVNYLTKYSGITPKMMENVTTRIEDVQRDIRALLPADAILVGQSLSGDMKSLHMTHPFVIDTSVIYNITGKGGIKTGLKKLTKMFLNEDIQCAGDLGHCSIEDSASALKLVQLKLSKGLQFGDVRWVGRKSTKVVEKPIQSIYSVSLLQYMSEFGKNLAVVDNIGADIFNQAFAAYEGHPFVKRVKASTTSEVVTEVENLVAKNDLTIAHLSEEHSTINEIDKAIKRIYDACSLNSLFIVITEESGSAAKVDNGLCFVKIKFD